MIRSIRSSILLAFVSLVFGLNSGCVSIDTMGSDLVESKAVYQSYSVDYDASEDRVTALAIFRAGGPGGTTLELISPSEVRLDDALLSPQEFLGTYYKGSFRRPKEYTFNWLFIDQNGKEYRNLTEIRSLETSNRSTKQSKRSDLIVDFSAPKMRFGEKIRARYKYTTDRKTTVVGYIDQVRLSGNRLIIESKEFSDFPLGATVEFRFERVYSIDVQEGTNAGGENKAIYRTAPVEFKIVN